MASNTSHPVEGLTSGEGVPAGCAMTGATKVAGQCDNAACSYPFCTPSNRTDVISPPEERWTLDGVMAEMLAVATASIEAEEGDAVLDEWPLDCRSDVDRWQTVIGRYLAASPKATTTASVREKARHIETLEYLRTQYLPGGPRDILGALRAGIAALTDSGTAATIGGERA